MPEIAKVLLNTVHKLLTIQAGKCFGPRGMVIDIHYIIHFYIIKIL